MPTNKKEIIDMVLSRVDNPEEWADVVEAISALNTESIFEQKYNKLKDAYVKKWGDWTEPDTVSGVVDSAIGTLETDPIRVEDLDMSFDGSTE